MPVGSSETKVPHSLHRRGSAVGREWEVGCSTRARILDFHTPRPAMCEVPRVRCTDAQHAGLPRIRRIAPDAPFLAMQQPWQD
jgi:hypothetical protein